MAPRAGRSWLRSLFGPPDVDRLVAEEDYEGLLKATRYRRDPAIRRAAINALPHSWLGGGSRSDCALTEALDRDPDVEVVAAALRKAAKSSLVYHWKKYFPLLLHPEFAIRSAAVEYLIACLKKVAGSHKSWVDERAPSYRTREDCLRQPAAESSLHDNVDEYVSLRDAVVAALHCAGGHEIAPNVAWLTRCLESNDLATYVVRTYRGEQLRHFCGDLAKLKWQPTKDAVGAAYMIWTEQWDMVVDMGAAAIMPLYEEFSRGCLEWAQREWRWSFYRTGSGVDFDHVSAARDPRVLALERIGEQAVVAMLRNIETGFFNSQSWGYVSRDVAAYLLLVFNGDRIPLSAETQATLDDACERIRKHLRTVLDQECRERASLTEPPW